MSNESPAPGWSDPEPQQSAPPPPPPPQAPNYPVAPYAGSAYGAYADPYAKSKLVAGLLGIFLGGFGIHRFYLGFTTIGVVQIVVTLLTCGLGALWGTVEGILYLVGAGGFTTDADGRPLRE